MVKFKYNNIEMAYTLPPVSVGDLGAYELIHNTKLLWDLLAELRMKTEITKVWNHEGLLMGHSKVHDLFNYVNIDSMTIAELWVWTDKQTSALPSKLACVVILAIVHSSLTGNSQNPKGLIPCLFYTWKKLRCWERGRRQGRWTTLG